MFFKRIFVRNFRNYSSLELDLVTRVNLFIGENGQGKTNLLEALYLLTKGESFRASKNDVLVNRTEGDLVKAIIKATIVRDHLSDEVKIEIGRDKKNTFLNEKRISTGELVQKFPSILFSPESLAAIKNGPDERRKLIDEALVTHDLSAADILFDYKKILKTRNKVLKDLRDKVGDLRENNRLLESVNDRFFQLATEVTKRRLDTLLEIKPLQNQAAKQVFGYEKVDISVEYLISQQAANHLNREEINNALYKRANQLKLAEIESGTSLVGPHKHDIYFTFDGADSRYFCSQGQQRALILSFKMAQVKYHYDKLGIYPVLFLDDVFSELDPERRLNLLSFLKEISSQIILTTTDISFPFGFEKNEIAMFKIKQGEVHPVAERL